MPVVTPVSDLDWFRAQSELCSAGRNRAAPAPDSEAGSPELWASQALPPELGGVTDTLHSETKGMVIKLCCRFEGELRLQ